MDLKETDILGDEIGNHWYYRSKAEAMMKLIDDRPPSVILDVGAGSGFFSNYLLTHTAAAESWCLDISYDRDSDTLSSQGKPIRFRRSISHCNADLVLLMDVLEHVDNDAALLADYVEKVPANARFLISVPAFQFLWSGHDEFLEHKRRYTLAEVELLVRKVGLKVNHGAYYFGLVFPLAAATRLGGRWLKSGNQPAHSQLKKHSPLLNEILGTVCRAEIPLMRSNRIAGLTVFCLAERS